MGRKNTEREVKNWGSVSEKLVNLSREFKSNYSFQRSNRFFYLLNSKGRKWHLDVSSDGSWGRFFLYLGYARGINYLNIRVIWVVKRQKSSEEESFLFRVFSFDVIVEGSGINLSWREKKDDFEFTLT